MIELRSNNEELTGQRDSPNVCLPVVGGVAVVGSRGWANGKLCYPFLREQLSDEGRFHHEDKGVAGSDEDKGVLVAGPSRGSRIQPNAVDRDEESFLVRAGRPQH